MEIDAYMDLARMRQGLNSDRKLAKALGVTPPTVNNWRQRRDWPSAGAIVRLAALAGADPTRALLHLNHWREKDETARTLYLKLAEKLAGALGALGLTLGLGSCGPIPYPYPLQPMWERVFGCLPGRERSEPNDYCHDLEKRRRGAEPEKKTDAPRSEAIFAVIPLSLLGFLGGTGRQHGNGGSCRTIPYAAIARSLLTWFQAILSPRPALA